MKTAILIVLIIVMAVWVVTTIQEIIQVRKCEQRLIKLEDTKREYAARVLYDSFSHYCDRCRYWEEISGEGMCSECNDSNSKWEISKEYAMELARRLEGDE